VTNADATILPKSPLTQGCPHPSTCELLRQPWYLQSSVKSNPLFVRWPTLTPRSYLNHPWLKGVHILLHANFSTSVVISSKFSYHPASEVFLQRRTWNGLSPVELTGTIILFPLKVYHTGRTWVFNNFIWLVMSLLGGGRGCENRCRWETSKLFKHTRMHPPPSAKDKSSPATDHDESPTSFVVVGY